MHDIHSARGLCSFSYRVHYECLMAHAKHTCCIIPLANLVLGVGAELAATLRRVASEGERFAAEVLELFDCVSALKAATTGVEREVLLRQARLSPCFPQKRSGAQRSKP